ncbi:hypothetical protein HMPREF0372_01182 [Flavonifractor plautii ATCC 29863]|uniref:Uncharacterized protein n=2 Tax=Flavonifractor plautii TaxID=292800 RepID=G9YNV4_FLAPL|nr:hypothetical protein HMPREF0372_01182 [Flavonifractor plautii ATCC 29863]
MKWNEAENNGQETDVEKRIMSEFNQPSPKRKLTVYMKQAMALLVSVLLYIGLFQVCFSILDSRIDTDAIIRGFALAVIGYFWIAGSLFQRRLGLERWQLWIAMNLVGLLLSFPVYCRLEPWQEELDLIILAFGVVSYLVLAWGITGIGYLCVRFVQFVISCFSKRQ